MVIFGKWKDQTLSLSLKPNNFTISLQRGVESSVYSFDGEGRLWTAIAGSISYRRGLNGNTVAKWQAGGELRQRRWLTPAETATLEESARQTARDLWQDLTQGHAQLNGALPSEAAAAFAAAISFDAERYQADVQRYHQVYLPVGILPPDQYMAVVLQATEGCSFNTCTFCNFYRDRRFRIRTPENFRRHALGVRDFLGKGLSLRRTIFLGDANALVVPMPRLMALLNVVHETFDVERLGGLYAFLDGFSGDKKSAEDFKLLAQQGMKRIYIGMESGNAELLRLLKKPGKPEDAVQAVRTIKAAGIAVGVIVLLGAGGHTYHAAHVKDTIQAMNAMRLGLDDVIYFSELMESEGLEYTQEAYRQNWLPLTPEERIAQGEEIEQGLVFGARRGVPHISRYDIREFVY